MKPLWTLFQGVVLCQGPGDDCSDFYYNHPNNVEEPAGEPFPLLGNAYIITYNGQSWVHAPALKSCLHLLQVKYKEKNMSSKIGAAGTANKGPLFAVSATPRARKQ